LALSSLFIAFSLFIIGSNAINLPSAIDPATYFTSASQGVIFYGVTGSAMGYSVSEAGDFNGDGIPDFVLTAGLTDPNGKTDAGEAYVIYGSATGTFPPTIKLDSLTSSEGVAIIGPNPSSGAGMSVESCGDVNGDKIDDIILGFPSDTPATGRNFAGSAYVIYGGTNLPASIDLASLSASQGVSIRGVDPSGFIGTSVSGVDDVNGDGYDDFVIGSGNGGKKAYLFYGSASLPSIIDLAVSSSSISYVTFTGDDGLGFSVSKAGDVNGDKIPDFLIGSFIANNDFGRVYLVYGRSGSSSIPPLPAQVDLLLAPSPMLPGIVVIDGGDQIFLGESVTHAGDVNSDGYDDFLISSSPATRLSRSNPGETYLIYGNNALPSKITLPNDLASVGVTFVGAYNNDNTGGASISGGSDVNQDGKPDILIAYPGSAVNERVYIIYGGGPGFASPVSMGSTLDLATLCSSSSSTCSVFGYATPPPASSSQKVGSSVSFVGDVNNDGAVDILIGSYGADGVSGRAYLVFAVPDPNSIPNRPVASPSSDSIEVPEPSIDPVGEPQTPPKRNEKPKKTEVKKKNKNSNSSKRPSSARRSTTPKPKREHEKSDGSLLRLTLAGWLCASIFWMIIKQQ